MHTDQYLNVVCHHPKHQKLGVVRTLRDRCETITTEEGDKKEEVEHLSIVRVGGYSPSALKRVTDYTKEKKKTKSRTKNKDNRSQVVIPYVEGVSERIHQVMMKTYGIATATRPHRPTPTPRHLLGHPEDKVELPEQGELVYRISCTNCGAECIGEPGRLLKTRLDEHRKDADNTNIENYTRSGKLLTSTNPPKSAGPCNN